MREEGETRANLHRVADRHRQINTQTGGTQCDGTIQMVEDILIPLITLAHCVILTAKRVCRLGKGESSSQQCCHDYYETFLHYLYVYFISRYLIIHAYLINRGKGTTFFRDFSLFLLTF